MSDGGPARNGEVRKGTAMKRLLLAGVILLLMCGPLALKAQPPATRQQQVVDTYFGKQVVDNYRWLENMNDKEVQDWFKAQHDYTESTLDRIPGRDSLVQTLVYYNSLRPVAYSGITRKSGRYFYKKTLPDEVVGKLYYRQGERGDEVLLYDAGKDEKGTPRSISFFLPSEDGKKVALGITAGGAEVSTIYIIDVDAKQLYPEKIYPSWFGVSSWSPDSRGFIYTLQNNDDRTSMSFLVDTKSFYHAVGTEPSADKELFSRRMYPDMGIKPEDLCFVSYTEDFKYIVATLAGVQHDLNCFYAPASHLLDEKVKWARLFQKDDQVTDFVAKGDSIYFLTYKGAPEYKVLLTTFLGPDAASAAPVVPEGATKIESIARMKDYLLCTMTDGINSRIYRCGFDDGRIEEIQMPFTGTVRVSALDIKSDDALLFLTSWTRPTTVWSYNPKDGKPVASVWNVPANYPGVDDIVVEELQVPSHDGVEVPLSLMYRKDLKRDGSAVCFMTGYGAYGTSADPYFSILNLALLNKGVIVAETHPRGGGEKGDDWYKAGYKATKPNTWKDFIACGDYLVKNKYTSPEHLIGEGTSAGGILIGRAITERPDLFAAAIDNVGCSNALRFENTPNGLNNAREFGTVKDSLECMALYEMDAFQHVHDGTKYPAVVCVGGMNDPRVSAWQPGKFAAALQNATASGKPVLLQVNYDSGHFTEDKKVTFRSFATMYAFALWQAGHPEFQPK